MTDATEAMQRVSLQTEPAEPPGRVQKRECLQLLDEIAVDEERLANKLVLRFGQRAYSTVRALRGTATEAQAQAQTLRTDLGETAD